MKVLGIVGSPRKGGNTEFLMRETLKACKEEGAETKLIHLTDFDLKPCDGCRSCFKTGNCVIKDDAEKIFNEIVTLFFRGFILFIIDSYSLRGPDIILTRSPFLQ